MNQVILFSLKLALLNDKTSFVELIFLIVNLYIYTRCNLNNRKYQSNTINVVFYVLIIIHYSICVVGTTSRVACGRASGDFISRNCLIY